MLTRFDVAISPMNSPLEQYIIEVDAIGVKADEKFVKDFFPQMTVLCVSPHKDPVQIKPTLRDRIEWTVRRLRNG